MTIPEMYASPVRAQRVLRGALQVLPDEVLARRVLGGGTFHCLKDLLLHTAVVEARTLTYLGGLTLPNWRAS